MPKQTPKRNLLIVCEGTVTEPFYFRILADKAIEKGEWDSVRIIPEPRDLDNNDQQKDNKRPKRFFQNASVDVPKTTFLKADETEKKYLQSSDVIYPTPLGFVKEARDRLSEGAYDEAWVVFDRNGHPAHEAAFALAAETDKPVKIAFSSRSFEQWVLGHFEQSLTPFEATECKIRQKSKNIPLDCQGDKPLEGSCEGDKCLVGYIRKNHLSDYSKKGTKSIKSVFEKLSETESMDKAIINAAWLRAKQREILRGCKNKPYLLNPYTTVDLLVKRLLGITENIEWVELNTTIVLPNLDIVFELTGLQFKMTFTNKSNTVFMLNQTHFADKFYCVDAQNKRYDLTFLETFMLPPNQTNICIFILPNINLVEGHIHIKIETAHFILAI